MQQVPVAALGWRADVASRDPKAAVTKHTGALAACSLYLHQGNRHRKVADT